MAAAARLANLTIAVLTGLAAPVFLKQAIDALGATPTQAAVHAAVIALLLSGACRVLNSLAKEAQGPLFTPVSQASNAQASHSCVCSAQRDDERQLCQHQRGSACARHEHAAAILDTWVEQGVLRRICCGVCRPAGDE